MISISLKSQIHINEFEVFTSAVAYGDTQPQPLPHCRKASIQNSCTAIYACFNHPFFLKTLTSINSILKI